jgi:hypothetical protein
MLLDLASGTITRECASAWASKYVLQDVDVRDEVVWRAIKRSLGADLKSSSSEYLHGQGDFLAWLREFDFQNGRD